MAGRNGSGVFTVSYPDFVSGTVISSSEMDSNFSDVATALTQSIAADGQTTITGNLPMATYRHTGVGNAAARDDYAAAGQVQDSALVWGGTAGGTANALTLTLSPAITAYATGQRFAFKAGASPSSAAATMNINSVGTAAIEIDNAALSSTVIIEANKYYEIVYDGTAFQLTRLSRAIASQAQAEAGTDTVTSMTPERTAQAIAALATPNLVQIQTASTSALATGTTTMPQDDTIPQNTEGDEYETVTITPTSASNRLFISFVGLTSHTATGDVFAALFQDSTADALAAAAADIRTGTALALIALTHEMAAGTTSATTFKIRLGSPNAGTTSLNGQSGSRRFGAIPKSTMIVMEYAP